MASIEKLRIRPKSGAVSVKRNDTDGLATSQILRDGNVIQWDATVGTIASVTLDSDIPSRTVALPYNIQDRTRYTLILRQDGTGGADVVFDSAFIFPNGAPRIGLEANSAYRIEFLAKKEKNGEIKLESIGVAKIA
jgi:hypothetical protein